MSDPNLPPPPPNEPPSAPPTFPAPPTGPAAAPQPPAPGQWGAPPPQPPAPGQWGAPPPAPGQQVAPQPGQFGAPPPPGGFSPPPGGFQPAAQPYQYGAGAGSQFDLAAPGKRILGRIIDWLIMAAVLVPVYIIVVAAGSSSSTSTSTEFGASDGIALGGFFLLMLLATVGQVLYEVAFIAVKGATPGKMLMKVRVVREADGQIPGWGPAFMRWLPNLVGMVPCVGSFLSLGLVIWALVNLFNNPKRQTPFDLAAKTVVIDASRG